MDFKEIIPNLVLKVTSFLSQLQYGRTPSCRRWPCTIEIHGALQQSSPESGNNPSTPSVLFPEFGCRGCTVDQWRLGTPWLPSLFLFSPLWITFLLQKAASLMRMQVILICAYKDYYSNTGRHCMGLGKWQSCWSGESSRL